MARRGNGDGEEPRWLGHVREENAAGLDSLAMKLAEAIAVAELQERSGLLLVGLRFTRGRVKVVGSGVGFAFGLVESFVDVLCRVRSSGESELF